MTGGAIVVTAEATGEMIGMAALGGVNGLAAAEKVDWMRGWVCHEKRKVS